MSAKTMETWLSRTRFVVCVGSGGVGKTTSAAAIALHAARQGRRAMVLTIDPARRLANSLGLSEIGGRPTQIDLSALGEACEGQMWAAMLDSRSTFDALIAEVAPSPEVRDRILNNAVYRNMAETFAGSQDYMATEMLYDLSRDSRFDLVVLDTPPVKNALDFLEAPGRVVGFLDEKILGWLLRPYDSRSVWTQRLFAGTSAMMFRLLGAVFGREFLDELAVFLHEFRDLYEGFRTRHAAVLELLRRQDTQFVAVAAPTASAVSVARFFTQELADRGLNQGGVILNQLNQPSNIDAKAPAHDRLSAVIAEAIADRRQLASRERECVAPLLGGTGGFVAEVPRLSGEVHDLGALARLGEQLFAN